MAGTQAHLLLHTFSMTACDTLQLPESLSSVPDPVVGHEFYPVSINHILGRVRGRKPARQRPVIWAIQSFLYLWRHLDKNKELFSRLNLKTEDCFSGVYHTGQERPGSVSIHVESHTCLPPSVWEPMQGLPVPGWELHPPCLTFLLRHPKIDTFPGVGQQAGAEPEPCLVPASLLRLTL